MIAVAILTISDSASEGTRADLSGPAVRERVEQAGWNVALHETLPDEQEQISRRLAELADRGDLSAIFTTGGTGVALRDVTPEATRAVIERELPGFGEIMRVQSFATVPTAILSRSTAGTRGRSLILNLPGNPKAIGECLPMLVPAIREALKHLRDES